MSNDFDIFRQECSWFLHQTDTVEIAKTNFITDGIFQKNFPDLNKLLTGASVEKITLTRKQRKKETVYNYRLFTWETKNETKAGWLCKIEADTGISLLPEHQLLLDIMGGIQESYEINANIEKLTDNMDFLFIKSMCTAGMDADNKEYYVDLCEDEKLKPLNTENFLCFAMEANGNATYYDLKTTKVYLFATDHCFDNVTEVEEQPEYTFYTINGAGTFVNYVEKLARQWLDEIQ